MEEGIAGASSFSSQKRRVPAGDAVEKKHVAAQLEQLCPSSAARSTLRNRGSEHCGALGCW